MITEADWKHFKRVKAELLEGCCQQILADVQEGLDDEQMTPHEKYIYLFKLMENGDKRIAAIFNYNARSKVPLQLALMYSEELLQPHHILGFSEPVQEFIRRHE